MKLRGIVEIELTGTRSKRQTLTLTYKGQSKSVDLHSDLYLDELAKTFRDLADWLDILLSEQTHSQHERMEG